MEKEEYNVLVDLNNDYHKNLLSVINNNDKKLKEELLQNNKKIVNDLNNDISLLEKNIRKNAFNEKILNFLFHIFISFFLLGVLVLAYNKFYKDNLEIENINGIRYVLVSKLQLNSFIQKNDKDIFYIPIDLKKASD